MAIARKSISEKVAESTEVKSVKNALEGATIMGIDPGTNFMGYAVLKVVGGNPKVVVCGTISLSKFSDAYVKLAHIFSRVTGLVMEYRPSEMALEAPFYGKNPQSMLKLGRAQGVAMAAALARNIDVFEYEPKRVKQSVTGSGAASKEQVAGLLQRVLEFDASGEMLDATDALAVAVCHFFAKSNVIK